MSLVELAASASLTEEERRVVREALVAHEAELAKRETERAELVRQIEALRLELEKLRRQTFGRKSERVAAGQLELMYEMLTKQLADLPPAAPKNESSGNDPKPPTTKKRHAHGRRDIEALEHLPIVELRLTPKEVPAEAHHLGDEISWRLESQPARVVRLKIIRPVYVRDLEKDARELAGCDTTVWTTPMPLELLSKSMVGPHLLADILVDKFCDHLPFHRQEDRFEREGLSLSRGTMCRWAEGAHEACKGVVAAMFDEARTKAHVLATDATGVLVQAPEQCKRGHFFVVLADRDHALFHYTPTHTKDAAKALFQGFRGYLQADAAKIYDALYGAVDGATEVACWAHARRYFYDALPVERDKAMAALAMIGKLFALDDKLKSGSHEKRRAERKRLAEPLTTAFFRWVDEEAALRAHLPRDPLTRALGYAQNQRAALLRFLEDGRLRLDNNPSELALRRLVVGRKNWLFVGSDESAPTTATFVSLIASCTLHKVEPRAYLRDLFRVLPHWPKDRLLELCPRDWTRTRARLDAEELAAPLGDLRVPALDSPSP